MVRQLSRGTTTREAHWLRQRPNTSKKKKNSPEFGDFSCYCREAGDGKELGWVVGAVVFQVLGQLSQGCGCGFVHRRREGPRREGAFGRNGEASRSDSVPREPGSGWVKGFLKKTEQEVDALPQLSFIHSPGTVDAVQCTQLRGPVSSIVP